MKVLFDTNVVLDLLLDRTPCSLDAAKCLSMVKMGEVEGWLCATTVTTLHYLIGKSKGTKKTFDGISLAGPIRNRPSGRVSFGKRTASAVPGL